MPQENPNKATNGFCLRRLGLFGVLCLLIASAQVVAAVSGEQALRTRVEQLYGALQQSDWRKVEKFLTKESRPIYRAGPKKSVTEYQIDSVKVQADGKSAEVVVRLPAPPGMIAGPPVFIPQTSVWRMVGGRWYLQLPDPHVVHRLPGPGDQQQPPAPPLSINSTDLKFQSTWVSLGFVYKGEAKVARFPFTNVSQHTVTLAEVHSTCPYLRMTSQQKEFKPGEAGVIEFTLDPSSFSFKTKVGLTLTVSVETEPEHAMTQLTIAAAITPGAEPTQHP